MFQVDLSQSGIGEAIASITQQREQADFINLLNQAQQAASDEQGTNQSQRVQNIINLITAKHPQLAMQNFGMFQKMVQHAQDTETAASELAPTKAAMEKLSPGSSAGVNLRNVEKYHDYVQQLNLQFGAHEKEMESELAFKKEHAPEIGEIKALEDKPTLELQSYFTQQNDKYRFNLEAPHRAFMEKIQAAELGLRSQELGIRKQELSKVDLGKNLNIFDEQLNGLGVLRRTKEERVQQSLAELKTFESLQTPIDVGKHHYNPVDLLGIVGHGKDALPEYLKGTGLKEKEIKQVVDKLDQAVSTAPESVRKSLLTLTDNMAGIDAIDKEIQTVVIEKGKYAEKNFPDLFPPKAETGKGKEPPPPPPPPGKKQSGASGTWEAPPPGIEKNDWNAIGKAHGAEFNLSGWLNDKKNTIERWASKTSLPAIKSDRQVQYENFKATIAHMPATEAYLKKADESFKSKFGQGFTPEEWNEIRAISHNNQQNTQIYLR